MNPLAPLLRAARVLLLAAGYGLRYLLTRPFDRTAGPRLLRLFFQSCGACFVKAGQVLATRYDLVPAVYCQELSQLFDRMPSMPLEAVRAVIAEDLGRPLEELFAEFDPVPLASASIAQVHAARLPSGESVVVKVQHPRIARLFAVDLALIHRVARFTRRHRLLVGVDLSVLAQDFIEMTREELDFRREARNTARMRDLLASDHLNHCAPRVFFERSASRVITLERMIGVPVLDLMDAVDRADHARLAEWAARGITPAATADLLLRSVLEQTMRHRLFQADPHPANLIVLDGGSLAWIDFGMLGWLDERAWLQQFRLRGDVAFGRIHAAYERFLEVLQPLPPADLSGFEMRVKSIIRDWTEASASPHASLREKSSGYFLVRLFGAIRGSGLSLPANVMRLYRTVIVADSIMLRLAPELDWIPILRQFIEAETRRQLLLSVKETFSAPAIGHMLSAALHGPAATVQLIDWLNSRLPQFGWTYQQRMSAFEMFLRLLVSAIRLGLLAAAVALLGSLAASWLAGPSGWLAEWAAWGGTLHPWPAPLAVGAVALAVGLGRILDAMDAR